MNTKGIGLVASATTLALLSGCGFAAGALFGNERLGDGHMPWASVEFSDVGTSVVCLGSEDMSPALDDGLLTIEGARVVSVGTSPNAGFDNQSDCWNHPDTSIVLRDADNNEWTIGYAWYDANGWDTTPWADIWEGDTVDLTFRTDLSSEAAGFAIFEPGGDLIYAMESGRDGQGLQNGDIPGFDVQIEGVAGTVETDCGDREALSVEYNTGSDRLVLFPAEDGGFDFNGRDYTACNINSYAIDAPSCDDSTTSENSYVLFDRAPTRGVD